MKKFALGIYVLGSCITMPLNATEYIYRDLLGNSLSSTRCDSEANATATAVKSYNIDRYTKKFCQSQGYGWHVEKVKNIGKTVCDTCNDDRALKTCHQEDILVTCKRIKPGTVGMLPGKG